MTFIGYCRFIATVNTILQLLNSKLKELTDIYNFNILIIY